MLHSHLLQIIAFLGFSAILVFLFKKWGLGSVLGYLAAGIIIGPQGFALIEDYKNAQSFAEFGVVFLLFVIGLELQPRKLWSLRKTLIGFGGLQILFCSLAFGAIAHGFGISWSSGMAVGFAMSLSSTAFALQSLTEKKVLNTSFGRSAFAILLMQDVVAIPALALIPVLGVASAAAAPAQEVHWLGALGIVAALAVASRTIMAPFLRIIAGVRSRELFTSITLFIVIGVAFLMEEVGLSMALGAFLGGVFLSESEYRHELEADLEPFKGILMGLFFVSVGMSVNVQLLESQPAMILGATLAYMVIKGGLIYAVGLGMGLTRMASRHLAIYLIQGGEFAFVIFGVGQSSDVIPPEWSQSLTLVVTLSMILSPFLIAANEKFQNYLNSHVLESPQYDKFEGVDNPVIIAGFGRFGQIFGRILRTQNISFTAIDHDSEQIELLRRFDNKVYYGDASRKEILEAAGVKNAKYFILAVDDVETSKVIAEILRKEFPHVKVFARARNRQHAYDLLDMGIKHMRRETIESSLSLTQELLEEFLPVPRAKAIIDRFRVHDRLMLLEQYKVRGDQKISLDIFREGAQQLAQVLREDEQQSYIEQPGTAETDAGNSPGAPN